MSGYINFKFKDFEGSFPVETFNVIAKFLPPEDCLSLSQTCQQLQKISAEPLFKYYENNKYTSTLSSKKFVRLTMAVGEKVTVLDLKSRRLFYITKDITETDMLHIAERCPNIRKITIGGPNLAFWNRRMIDETQMVEKSQKEEKFRQILKNSLAQFKKLEKLKVINFNLYSSKIIELLKVEFNLLNTINYYFNPFFTPPCFKKIVADTLTIETDGYSCCTSKQIVEIYDLEHLEAFIPACKINNQIKGLVFQSKLHQISKEETEKQLTLLGSCNSLQSINFGNSKIDFNEKIIQILIDSKQAPEHLVLSRISKKNFEMLSSSSLCKRVKKLEFTDEFSCEYIPRDELVKILSKNFEHLTHFKTKDWGSPYYLPDELITELTNNPKFLPNLSHFCMSDLDSLNINTISIEEAVESSQGKIFFVENKNLLKALYIARPHLFVDLLGVGGRYVDNLDFFKTEIKEEQR